MDRTLDGLVDLGVTLNVTTSPKKQRHMQQMSCNGQQPALRRNLTKSLGAALLGGRARFY